ncbi:MAG: dethiobiotin synthase [Pirellulaceae bacterium]
MFKKPPRGLFVTGISTESGKTFVAALIARALKNAGHNVGVYKPAASDCVKVGQDIVSEDATVLWEAAGRPLNLEAVCPQRFQAVLAPHLAAKAEGREIDSALLRSGLEPWADSEVVVVEGAGGLMSPIGDHEFVADVANDLGYPLIVVVPNVLGCINYTMQTLIAAACYGEGLEVAGIVMTHPEGFEGDVSTNTNAEEISRRAVAPLLAKVSFGADDFDTHVDWLALSQPPQVRAAR